MAATTGARNTSASDTTARFRQSLAHDLAHPPLKLSGVELCGVWDSEVIRVAAEAPELLENFPDLPIRIRGALGWALEAVANETPPRRRRHLSAYELLFKPIAERAPGLEIPKPLTLRAWVDKRLLTVELRLFGEAAACMPEAAEALVRTLEGGISLRTGGRQRVPVRVIDVFGKTDCGVAVPRDGATMAVLRFRSPVTIRHKVSQASHARLRAKDDARAILNSIERRVASLARWQMAELVEDKAILKAVIDELAVDETDMVPIPWVRHSVRQGNIGIPMQGYVGTLRAVGRLGPLLPLLALAAECNTGSHASLGLGWFDLVVC